ncbi:MAG: GIY-YIG nuclease family protein [Alphaproteobacteria bacterium]|jgi:putative endonuclease|nr:GIY-YIG nuclease family protein [Alphaproteobacteria bacterium]MBT5540878.1 GIY-YIG nuclease family protein [Alphaproteobacteria bacterium]
MDEKSFYVYIMASKKNGTLYVGLTSNMSNRVWQHRAKVFSGFTAKYDVNRLVYLEPHDQAENAISREKQLKHWCRRWKIDLIEKDNSNWDDLSGNIF